MSDEQPTKAGAGRTVALVIAFLTMPVPIYLMANAGYTGGRMKSTRLVVRRLAVFTLIVATAGWMGSCAGGCVWGRKVNTNEWPEPRL